MGKTMSFTIRQLGSNRELERARGFLEGDKRVKAIGETFGQYYTVPDREDLPEWTLLTIDVRVRNVAELSKFMAEFKARFVSVYGEACLAELDFDTV